MNKGKYSYETPTQTAARIAKSQPIEDLLRKQREHKPLTIWERKRIQKYAEERRKKNQHKSK